MATTSSTASSSSTVHTTIPSSSSLPLPEFINPTAFNFSAASLSTASPSFPPPVSTTSNWTFVNPYGSFQPQSTVTMTTQALSNPPSNPYALSNPYPNTPNLQSQITLKLDSTNYVLWKAQVLSAVRGSGLAQHLDDRMAPPSEYLANNTVNPVHTIWYQKDQQVLSWILGSVSVPLLPHIATATSAIQAWTKLTRAYASGARSRVVNLKDELHQ